MQVGKARSRILEDLLPAVILGLISSTFSTAVSQLAAGRLGRDAAVDWMTVAAIPFGNSMLAAEPAPGAILAGIAFHQWADFSWVLFFFIVLHRFTAELSAGALLINAIPWALVTSALEWLILVPVFPFNQPIFTLQQPYWIGFMVHLSSAVAYPLFPALRQRLVHKQPWPRSAKLWAYGASIALVVFASADVLARHDREFRWIGRTTDQEPDRTFVRHMSAHHRQGIELAQLAIARTKDPELKQLAKLMVASQTGERVVFERWWKSWFGPGLETCGTAELETMPGYLSPDRFAAVEQAADDSFDATFVAAMTTHHEGAVRMAHEQLIHGSDPRLRAMAQAIRHEQQGEVALMHGARGWAAVQQALKNMVADQTEPAK
jgi:uncharacterized protein (DUF305 family)